MPRRSPLVALLLLLPVGPLGAGTLRVPLDHQTIAAALAASVEGDEIVLAAGLYRERIVLEEVDLRTIRGRGRVILEPPGDAAGIHLTDCSDLLLENLWVRFVRGRGVQASGCDRLTVRRCRITRADSDGMRIVASHGILLEDNRIEDVIGNGIRLGAHQALITGNTVEVVGRPGFFDGIVVHGDGIAVTSNRIRHTTSNGIQVGAAGGPGQHTIVQGNRIADVAGDGILLFDTRSAVVFDNRIRDVGGSGIALLADAQGDVLSHNRIRRVRSHGVRTAGSGTRLLQNRIDLSGEHGLLLDAQARQGVLIGNQIGRSAEDGVHILSQPHTLLSNRTRASGLSGIQDQTGEGTANIRLRNRFD